MSWVWYIYPAGSFVVLEKNSKFARNWKMILVLAVTSAINGRGSLSWEDYSSKSWQKLHFRFCFHLYSYIEWIYSKDMISLTLSWWWWWLALLVVTGHWHDGGSDRTPPTPQSDCLTRVQIASDSNLHDNPHKSYWHWFGFVLNPSPPHLLLEQSVLAGTVRAPYLGKGLLQSEIQFLSCVQTSEGKGFYAVPVLIGI